MSWPKRELIFDTGAHIPVVANQDFDLSMAMQGRAFVHSNRHTGLASAGNLDHVLTVGPNPIIMRALHISSTGSPVRTEYYSGPSFSGGTAQGIGNNNTTSSRVTECTMVSDPTVTAVGSPLAEDIFPDVGGGGQSGIAGAIENSIWILAPNTSYLIRLINDDSQAVDAVFNFAWYEPYSR